MLKTGKWKLIDRWWFFRWKKCFKRKRNMLNCRCWLTEVHLITAGTHRNTDTKNINILYTFWTCLSTSIDSMLRENIRNLFCFIIKSKPDLIRENDMLAFSDYKWLLMKTNNSWYCLNTKNKKGTVMIWYSPRLH